jgi:hypothetical protein
MSTGTKEQTNQGNKGIGGNRKELQLRRELPRPLRAIRIGNPSRLVLIPYRFAGERRE